MALPDKFIPSEENVAEEVQADKVKESPEAEKTKTISSLRMRIALKLWGLLAVKGKIRVEGQENLEKIPTGKRCIVATSHISDGDLPVAYNALGDKFDLAIANQSTHHSIKEEPVMRVGLAIAGKKNFFPVDFVFDASVGRAGKRGIFNPSNYVPMKTALEEKGKTMLMAAHSPTYGELPEKGGIGMVYLAQITNNCVIVPVSSDLQHSSGHVVAADSNLKNLVNKPDAKVIIGEPIELPKIEGIDKFQELADKESKNEATLEEIRELHRLKHELRRQSDYVMQKIADMLPKEKRGKTYR